MADDKLDFYSKTSLRVYNLNESARYQLETLGTLDVFTRKHSENVANITCRLCEYLDCTKNFTEYCIVCAYLHDIGKIHIPPEILQKQSPLTDEEFEIMKKHTIYGYNMCISDPLLRKYANGAKYHHEALNGSGYPEGLHEKDIPIEAQIIRVADEYDAITSKRQYKSHVGISDTLKMLIDEAQPIGKTSNPNIDPKKGTIKPRILAALFKVVIDDTEYEISKLCSYVDSLEEDIKRLELIEKYYNNMQKSKTEKKKAYFLEGINLLLQKGETLENFSTILEEYRNSLKTRSKIIKDLYDEIKKIKKLRV